MRIEISNTVGDKFELSISSGHFSGKLTDISREDMNSLEKSIHSVLHDFEATHTYVWNPRSQRHEKV